jgi:hypothetical protein
MPIPALGGGGGAGRAAYRGARCRPPRLGRRPRRRPAGRDDPRAAVASLSEALVLTGERIGTDHPEVLAATRVLAALHKQLGELPEARSLLENAIAAGQFTRGERDPVMLGLAFDLAHVAHELENRHEARRNFERVRRYGPAVLGPEHEYVRVAQRYLGGPPAGGTSAPVAAPAGRGSWCGGSCRRAAGRGGSCRRAPVAAPPVAAPHPATVAPPPPGATRPIGRVPIQQIPMPPPVPVAPAPRPRRCRRSARLMARRPLRRRSKGPAG